jgi:GNAT superfamily N-acetyltransferase
MSTTILPFSPEHAPIFDRLNRAWIEELFTVEPNDEKVLRNPQANIIDAGGEIWFATWEGEIAATYALMPESTGVYEFAKLGVDKRALGRGLARALLRHAKERARAKGAHTLRILTNSKLVAANTLYRSEGFVDVPLSTEQRARYARVDIVYDYTL